MCYGKFFSKLEIEMQTFWDKVDKRAGENGCWLWTGYLDRKGYGRYFFPGDGVRGAHRVSAFLAGLIPSIKSKGGDWVLHRCDNPACVNPKHFFIGDHRANMDDMVMKKRMPHGENHCCAKLDDVEVSTLKLASSLGVRARTIAKHFGMNTDSIRAIKLSHTGKLRSAKSHDPVLLQAMIKKETATLPAHREDARRKFAKGDITRGELAVEYGVHVSSMCGWLKGVNGLRKKQDVTGRNSARAGNKERAIAEARAMWEMGLFNSSVELYEEFKWRVSWGEVLAITA
jgi:hypothetical protein